ncbi:hypothetical protein A361_20555 [Cytobacillus oceanisediminis 2691]|uniref:Uncharacterized protein n=1 Tax=Cytobacillus oceanisediminis 2691 TaxID=1196031 RepID=A0A160MHJ3_9BACI|nr:hypothetical protein A361_20555 [Cytobacillus oceanisediminis 2691]
MEVLPLLIILILIIFIVCLYFISRHKRQTVQVFTLESFMKVKHLDEIVNQNSFFDIMRDYFDENHEESDNANDGSDIGDSDDGGE